ncbi:hypothetical protein M426DRAFT_186897 [Hypoxylon sp. CI-4A]|nr:hypothetical protein M426DRAFT_186897 [Hypoxylon sp. CI-4A]
MSMVTARFVPPSLKLICRFVFPYAGLIHLLGTLLIISETLRSHLNKSWSNSPVGLKGRMQQEGKLDNSRAFTRVSITTLFNYLSHSLRINFVLGQKMKMGLRRVG